MITPGFGAFSNAVAHAMAEVRKQYGRLASKYHPARDGGDAGKMAGLNEARDDVLKECR